MSLRIDATSSVHYYTGAWRTLDRGDTRVVKSRSLLFEYLKHVQVNRIENVTFEQKVAPHGTVMACLLLLSTRQIFNGYFYVFLRRKKREKNTWILPHVGSTDNRTWDWSVMKNNVGVTTGLRWRLSCDYRC